MKLLQFGNILENGAGRIEFHYFVVDGEGTSLPAEEVLLLLVIERLQQDLTDLRGRN